VASRRISSLLPLVAVLVFLGALVSAAGALALLSRPTPAQAPVAVERRPASPCTPSAPCLAIVIDDLGRDPIALRELLRLDADLTFSVLPHAAHSAISVAAIRARGRELLLHLPLEPLDRHKITDERVVLGAEGDLAAATAECLARVPGAVGINNHLGSAVSADRAPVEQILGVVRERRLFFLDSRTSERSVICGTARTTRVPCLERDVFLDDPPEAGAIAARWAEAVSRARLRGRAIVIAHPHPTTIRALRDLVAGGRAWCRDRSGACGPQGLRVVRVSSLVEAEM
jgi:hypothetical protein